MAASSGLRPSLVRVFNSWWLVGSRHTCESVFCQLQEWRRKMEVAAPKAVLNDAFKVPCFICDCEYLKFG